MRITQQTSSFKKEEIAIKTDSVIESLINKDHLGIDTWVYENIRADVSLKDLLKKILYVVKQVVAK